MRLWIEDNGIGISPNYHEKIFGVFERLHAGDAYAGTGIGLAIVKQGIQRMGGQVGLESSPGAGSRFWLDLPTDVDSPASRLPKLRRINLPHSPFLKAAAEPHPMSH